MPGAAYTPAMAMRVGAVIVGAQKCGTTSLAAALAAHPSICLATGKEAHLFDDPAVQSRGLSSARLAAAFAAHRDEELLLDATPSYLYLPGCLEALVRHNPDVAAIAVLREPADRAISHYEHERARGAERLPLPLALLAERRRLRSDTDPLAHGSAARVASYRDRGRYAPQLARLSALVSRTLLLSMEQLALDPGGTLLEVHRFLGIAPMRPVEAFPHLNVGAAKRRRSLTRAVLARSLRGDQRDTERLLGWRPGSLEPEPGRRRDRQ